MRGHLGDFSEEWKAEPRALLAVEGFSREMWGEGLALWAGHRNAPLTNHGFNQAERLGQHFKDVPITAIYTSDLKRARTTAQAVYDANQSNPKPPFTVSTLLREQYFGKAEGEAWDAGKYSSAGLPWDEHRAFELAPEAESLNAVGSRADLALRHFLAPHILASSLPGAEPHHVVLVAHGIFLSEMLFSLKRAEDPNYRFLKSGGYENTAWARVEITPLLTPDELAAAASSAVQNPVVEAQPTTAGTGPESPYKSVDAVALPPRHASLPPALHPNDQVPVIKTEVIALNQRDHLEGLVRQKGGIGSAKHDEHQKKLKEYFAGGKGGGLEEWKGKV
ncbi:hypothetical protein RQP46_005984 [Phenoliferia psychrophenolica]